MLKLSNRNRMNRIVQDEITKSRSEEWICTQICPVVRCDLFDKRGNNNACAVPPLATIRNLFFLTAIKIEKIDRQTDEQDTCTRIPMGR